MKLLPLEKAPHVVGNTNYVKGVFTARLEVVAFLIYLSPKITPNFLLGASDVQPNLLLSEP